VGVKMGILRACFSFRGRMEISAYWAVLVSGLAVFVIGIIFVMDVTGRPGAVAVPIILGKWMMLAALAKRWHDCGYPGWLCLLNFVPGVGVASAVIVGFMAGTAGRNKFGEDPKHYPISASVS
jgi:uncharacterized membrane protein YhaH (DUF805 family)